jgi:hypothetical protein
MTDRELLELAAKAARLHHCGWDEEDQAIGAWFDDPRDKYEGGAWGDWNPLSDDAQALRLAVQLQLCLLPCDGAAVVETPRDYPDVSEPCTAETRLVAMRRAIVRAAAEIGVTL